ncbi:OsmC family peroxiredoxin [Xanthomonas sp. NCPPB 2654]|uniref:OsmC family peroxiredoxin n=1 Tax=unclassified Xanthomonas TaxID=2643310 RepID=UPI0021DFFEC4|nr:MULTISPECIES: OsmC family peroxiredoxin [unclassified Xanthomonas]MDL5367929.1 OsmC family peroxiredoxin [Xanthomonas sp. NCPPB 2654]UYC19784.1 OsmC family peroxiredoxin [Xanthomonas sp. CFBP 8443]
MSIGDPIRVTLEQETDFAFRIQFDETDLAPWLGDETAPLGHERGPNPSRILLASIVNGLAASLLFAMRKFKNDPVGVVAHITATPMRNADGFWRIPQASVELQLPDGNQSCAPSGRRTQAAASLQ